MKIEEPDSNDNEGSNKSSTTKDNDIKSRLRKNPNKTKVLYTNELPIKKSKKNSWKEPCREIIEALKKDEKSYLFRQPAIKSFSDPNDREYYKQQIKEPRDLGTIAKKLKAENYTIKEFYEDLDLCWSNALSFNDITTEAYQCAVYLKELTNKLFRDKGVEDMLEKYSNNSTNIHGEDKEINMNDNTNISNNNTNDSNNTSDKLNLNENNIENKNTNLNNYNEQIDSLGSNSSNKSNKDDESYDGEELKKNKIIGRKRGRPSNKEEVISIEQGVRGRKKKKILNDNSSKIKKILKFEDIEKAFPINYPIISSLEEIEKMIPKKIGEKNKSKKQTKMNSISDKYNENKKEKNANKGKNLKSNYKYDYELMDKKKLDKKTINKQLVELKNKKLENENMNNYDNNGTDNSKKNQNFNNEKKNNDNLKNNNNDVKIVNNAVKIVNEKTMELRSEIGKCFGCLTDNNMIKILVYIENIRPQSIRILENDTIYIDLEAFNEDTYRNVFDHLKIFFN